MKLCLLAAHKDKAAAVKMSLVPSLFFTAALLLWNDGTRLTYTAGSPLAAAEEAEEESGLWLASSGSAGLSWRMAGLGIKACLGGGSLGRSGAPLMGLVLCRGTGLTGTSLSETELSSSPSGREKPGSHPPRDEELIIVSAWNPGTNKYQQQISVAAQKISSEADRISSHSIKYH